MPLESTATYLNSFNPVWPDGADQRSTADDHIRLIKGALLRSFPQLTTPINVPSSVINNLGSLSFSLVTGGLIDTTKFTYPQTAAELAASVTPVNLYIPHHNAIGYALPARYGVVGDGVTNDTAAWTVFSDFVQSGNGVKGYIPTGTYLIDSWTISGIASVFEGANTSLISLTQEVKIKARSVVTNFITFDSAFQGRFEGMEIDGNNKATNVVRIANQITDFEWSRLTIGGAVDNGVNLNMTGTTTNTAISELGFHDIRLAGCGSRASGTNITNLLINSDQSLVIAFYRLKHFGNTAGATDVGTSVNIVRGTCTFYTPFATKVGTQDYTFGSSTVGGSITIIDGRSESDTADSVNANGGQGDITLINYVHGTTTNTSLNIGVNFTGRVNVLGGQFNNVTNGSATANVAMINYRMFGTGAFGGAYSSQILKVQGQTANLVKINTSVTSGVSEGEILLANQAPLAWANKGATAQRGSILINDVGAMADSTTAVIGVINKPIAIMDVIDSDAGEFGVVAVRGGINSVSIVSDPLAIFSTAAGTANKINVYYSAGNARYEIENKRGAQRTFTIHTRNV